MFQSLRKHLSYANVAATMALVFALTGGAVAATSHGGGGAPAEATASVTHGTPVATTTTTTTAKKKKKPTSTRGPAGPKGATGATGPAGPAGPTGATGAKGETGAVGSPGAPGTGTEGPKGANGESVTIKSSASGTIGSCKEGGSEFTVGSTKGSACNGKTGFTETLPAGKTETGTWASQYILLTEPGETKSYSPISFAIPLQNPLRKNEVHFVTRTEQKAGGTSQCPGNVSEPFGAGKSPLPGNLCVYEGPGTATEEGTLRFRIDRVDQAEEGAGTTGAIVSVAFVVTSGSGVGEASGTWAVTG